MNSERRDHQRFPARMDIDYRLTPGQDFLFSYIENISELGLFICTATPPEVGTELTLRFAPCEAFDEAFELEGTVCWTNERKDDSKPGMGVKFASIDEKTRKKILRLVRTVAYLPHEGGDA